MGRIAWPAVVDRAAEIADEYRDLGCTLRMIHYQLVSAQIIPNTMPMYRRLSARLAQARRDGRDIPMIDPERAVHTRPAWPDNRVFLREMPDLFGLDRTVGQAEALYIAAEKDTLRALLTKWVGQMGIPVLVARGFGSQSYVDVVRDRTARDPRQTRLLYVGDFDASGEDIERDWIKRTDCWDVVQRVALTREQVLGYELPPVEGKRNDPRWPGFAERHGLDPDRPVQWEVEALSPDELQRLVLDAVEPHLDRAVLAGRIAEERRQRATLRWLSAAWLDEDEEGDG